MGLSRDWGDADETELTAFTDGCPSLRCILADAGVMKPPILGWFHIAMRMQHAAQAATGLSTDGPDRVKAKAVIVAEVERLRWRIWNGKAKNAQRSIDRIRRVMHAFKGERGHRTKRVSSRKLWSALHAADRYLRGQSAWSRRGADLLLQVRCAVYNGTFGSGLGHPFQPHANQNERSANAA
jgi:hypothetical protein